jgi:hypothetical protein
VNKDWDGNFRDIPLDHFEKMKSTARMLAKVKKQPEDDKKIFIRIGLSGTGVRPNYQVELFNSAVTPINGINHEAFGVEEFDRQWVSKRYSIDDLNTMRLFGGILEADDE